MTIQLLIQAPFEFLRRGLRNSDDFERYIEFLLGEWLPINTAINPIMTFNNATLLTIKRRGSNKAKWLETADIKN